MNKDGSKALSANISILSSMPAAVQSQDSGVFSDTSSQMLNKSLFKGKGKGKNRFLSSSETSSGTQSGLSEPIPKRNVTSTPPQSGSDNSLNPTVDADATKMAEMIRTRLLEIQNPEIVKNKKAVLQAAIDNLFDVSVDEQVTMIDRQSPSQTSALKSSDPPAIVDLTGTINTTPKIGQLDQSLRGKPKPKRKGKSLPTYLPTRLPTHHQHHTNF